MQTEPPPPTSFSVNVGERDIHDAYMSDQIVQQRLQQEIQDKKKDKDVKKVVSVILLCVYLLSCDKQEMSWIHKVLYSCPESAT